MTRRDEVIRMADEAGIDYSFGEEMERFAALVAKAERERCAKACSIVASMDNDNVSAGACATIIRSMKDEVTG